MRCCWREVALQQVDRCVDWLTTLRYCSSMAVVGVLKEGLVYGTVGCRPVEVRGGLGAPERPGWAGVRTRAVYDG